jgi:hypothetical protein
MFSQKEFKKKDNKKESQENNPFCFYRFGRIFRKRILKRGLENNCARK